MKSIQMLLAGLVTMIGACQGPAFFSSPLSQPGQSAIDESVLGVWYAPEEKKLPAILNVARIGDDRLGITLSVMASESKTTKGFEKSNFTWYMIAHPTELDGQRSYNVSTVSVMGLKESIPSEKLDSVAGYMIHTARIVDDDWLVIFTIKENTPARLAGWSEADGHRVGKSKRYMVSQEELTALIATADGEELFKPLVFFRRLPPVTKESVPSEILDLPGLK